VLKRKVDELLVPFTTLFFRSRRVGLGRFVESLNFA
jgi:hypothetical protein